MRQGDDMMSFLSFSGEITKISDFGIGSTNERAGCYKIFSIEDREGVTANFVVEPSTYFVDRMMMKVGNQITAFYDGNDPAPLIYPPQYRSVVIVKDSSHKSVKVDFFNEQYESSDGQLILNIEPDMKIILENGQQFDRSPVGRNLIVIYGATTRSIPAQTTPSTVIVMCK